VARRRPAPVLALLGTALLLAACSSDPAPRPGTTAIAELGVAVPLPGPVADLTYAVAEGPEGRRVAQLSTRSLARAGGAVCAAGATGAVSGYPLGQITVAAESRDEMQVKDLLDPEESVGDYVGPVGDRYLYYQAPPQERCASGRAGRLQSDQEQLVRSALRQARPLPAASPAAAPSPSAAPAPAAGAPGRSTPG
jgi:hypothetical protein